MDEERWREIASSFNYGETTHNHNHQQIGKVSKFEQSNLSSSLLNPSLERNQATPSQVQHPSSQNPPQSTIHLQSQSQSKFDQNSITRLEEKIQTLTSFLASKSEIIKEQEKTISTLQHLVDSLVSGEPVQTLTPPPYQKVLTLDGPKAKEPKSKETVHRKGQTPLTKPQPPSKLHPNSISLILERIESLEKRLNQLVKTLPQKIQQNCEKYISKCKLVPDDSGKFLIAIIPPSSSSSSSDETTETTIKPIWERSPKIKPKFNHSFEIRQSILNNNSKSPPGSPSDPIYTVSVENHLNQLESVFNELKVGFLQLLLQRVNTRTEIPTTTTCSKPNGNNPSQSKNTGSLSSKNSNLGRLLCNILQNF